jgi:hypothetical protein
MGDRSDFLRSLVRGFAEGAGRRLGIPFAGLQKMLREAMLQASSVSERQITKALTRVASVREASAVCRDERIWIEATFEDGESVQISIAPVGARFAPRGAKEVLFRVEPENMAGRARARDLVGAIAALIAHALWAPFFGRLLNPSFDAIAERDGGRSAWICAASPRSVRRTRRGSRSCSICWSSAASEWSMARCASRSSSLL